MRSQPKFTRKYGWILLPFFLFSCSSSKVFRSAKQDLLNENVIGSAHIGISIYDVDSRKFIFDHDGDKYFVPASNTKIPACYAAMKYLGNKLPVFIYEEKGKDTIVIQGMGNPDFLHPDFKDQEAFSFLKKYRHIILSHQNFDDFLGNGWAWNDYMEPYMANRGELPLYGNIVFAKWKNGSLHVIPSYFKKNEVPPNDLKPAFDVMKGFQLNHFFFIPGTKTSAEIPFTPDIEDLAALLADTLHVSVEPQIRQMGKTAAYFRSRSVDSVLAPMMHRSDNFFAEQMLLMVSQQLLGKMNDADIIDTLLKTDLATLPQKPKWVDGSGLSRYNLFTPQDFVMILDKMRSEFGMERIKTIFPTGGEGTISSYYQEEKGQIFAKTGTLSGVVALSGYLYTKKGKLLLFSVLVNNHNGSATDVRRAVERFIRKTRSIK
ncbi:D-alanyl-D-alanine carboxypeptidase [Terrimonas sp. NA20]|uniref:D-alanyl-D-alanine carboxypeptidase n=1 Tax=Terrimonas ginsenosidimutans TaxID=2908004 RepID=A0ABS9KZ84_9BACT|nr:D-alanyl-D-alanine carboxypeptidase [Terrimonas ginsenosidimutans]MCG2617625.1 D-alanyl-D-alanine carboxypeptidase [Terrimonas ginsenosidimutans]